MLYRLHLASAGFELSALVVIGTDCIGSCKSNYHAITTTTAPLQFRKLTSLWKEKQKILYCQKIVRTEANINTPCIHIHDTSYSISVQELVGSEISVFAKDAESYAFYFLFFNLSLNYMTVDNYWRLEWQPQQFSLYW
jgi:hypothetical protein